MGVASLVLGILAVITCWVPCVGQFAIVPGILGIIFGGVGLNKAKKTGTGKGLSVAGLVCSIIATAFAIYWVFVISAATAEVASAASELSDALNAL